MSRTPDLASILFRTSLSLAAIVLMILDVNPARAELLFSIEPQTISVIPGSTGNAFDVTLSNTGPTGVTIGGFSFGLSVADLDIQFTEVNTATTVPYIFGADSLFGPIINTVPPPNGQSVLASDAYLFIDMGVTVSSGTTVGLGHVLFDVSSTATPGSFSITFDAYPFSSLAAPGPDFDEIPIDTFDSSVGMQVEGQNVVPEPSALLVWSSLSAMGLVTAWRRRKQGIRRG